MADQHDELARLLEHARTDAPSEPVLSEVRKRVLTTIAAGTAAESALVHGTTESLRATAQAGWLLKLGAGALALGLLVAAYFTFLPSPSPSPSLSPLPVPVPLPVPAPSPSPTIEGPAPEAPSLPPPAPKPKLRRPSRPAPEAATPPPAPSPPPVPSPNASFAEEVALLKAALAAQRAGNKDEARAKLDEHMRRFPNGQLISERKRIEARLAQ